VTKMSIAALKADPGSITKSPEALLQSASDAVAAADSVLQSAKAGVRAKVAETGGIDAAQHAAHGLAWLATTVEGLRQMHAWGKRLSEEGRFGEFEQLLLIAAFAEYLAQIVGGIPMSQVEIIRADALGVTRAEIRRFEDEVAPLIAAGSSQSVKSRLAELIAAQPGATSFGDTGLDETHAAIHEQMRKFSEAEVVPHAHEWHLANEYIPLDIITKVAELGVFGLTLPEEYGGLGLGKESMCIVSEELSRGYIGVGSLGTRSEIAGELILNNGTDEQKQKYLPKIASGELLPTAVFTEPNTGSDLASLKTRAAKEGSAYKVTGQKTWITHPVRADLMTLLVRTNPSEPGYKGLSMLLAEKPRGTDKDPFPAAGMTGGEIEVLGYRGMKEYDISFDGFEVPAGQLLGGV
jgi:(2S)-methylsuccinyl-CoA dehydrogenase